MTPYERDSQLISEIQFHSGYDQKTKNKLIRRIEKRMERMEQMELDGKNTGYYMEAGN